MPFHRVVVSRPDGTTEEFSARISVRGVDEWLAERDNLRLAGYPDRPPDVDTVTMRMWACRPGEEDLPYFTQERERVASGVFPVLTLWWVSETGIDTRVAVSGWPDGGFSTDVMLLQPDGMLPIIHKDYQPDDDPNKVWDDIENLIGRVEEQGGWNEDCPRTTWLWDFEEAAFALEVARVEHMRGFVNPLGEGRA
jgi:hypothetical protein